MPNYKNGKIYQIWTPHTDLVYVGSTVRALSARFSGHKTSKKANCASKQIIALGDARIELIEECPCENREQLNRREGEIMRTMKCVNKNVAGRTLKQYYQDRRETLLSRANQYYQDNKDKKREYYLKNKDKKLKYQQEYYKRKKLNASYGQDKNTSPPTEGNEEI